MSNPYVERLLTLVGDRDPIEILGEQTDALQSLVAGMSDEELRHPEGAGKWSVIQVVAHLADVEIVVGWRLRMILTHDEPEIEGYDQDLWVAKLHYNEAVLADALLQARVLRDANVKLLARFSRDELHARGGLHSERGRETAWRTIELLAGHDLVHRAQIARIKEAIART